MKLCRWATCGLAGFLCLAISAPAAQAARWQVTELGETRPFYAEHRFGVNPSGRAAWTALASGVPRARGFTGAGSQDLHALAPAGAALSYGQDIGAHHHIVGYASTSARESDRRALLWRWGGSSWTGTLDLHGAAVAVFGEQQQTAAYAVSDVTPGGELLVAGFRRARVGAGGTYSVPVVWTTDGLTIGVNAVVELGLGGYQYGVAYGVTEDGVVVGGVGQASGGASYMVAAWWDLNVDADLDGRPDLNLVPGVQTPGWSTSVANRVRRLTVDGDTGQYAVGTAIDPGGVLHAFVHRVGPGGWTDTQFVLPGGANALAFDAAVGSLGGQEGLQLVGASNNQGGALALEPNTAHGTDGAFLLDVGPQAQVCSIADALPAAAASIDMLNGASGQTRRVGWGDGRAWLLSREPTSGTLTVIVRDTPAQLGQGAVQHYWATRAGAVTNGSVLWSSSAGCGSATGCPDGTLDLAATGSNGNGHRRVAFAAAAAGTTRTGLVAGARPSQSFDWVQLSAQDGASCRISDVLPAASVEILNPPGADPWGGVWADCDGNAANVAETNTQVALNHCGSCGTSVNDGLSCTTDTCAAGAVVNTIQASSCLISGSCYGNGERRPETWGRNPCQRCASGTSQTSWSSFGNAACCTNGTPVLDSWDTSAPGALPDRNNGSSAGAWSAIANKNDGQNWSNANGNCVSDTGALDARFNPDVDVVDWYRFYINDNTNIWDPEPRVRLISTNAAPMELCLYVECTARANRIDNAIQRDGTSGMSTVTGPAGTPAAGLPGRCQNTQLRGGRTVADMELHTCDHGNNNDSANVYIRVRPIGAATDLECNALNYRLRWSQDWRGCTNTFCTNGGSSGCDSCCN